MYVLVWLLFGFILGGATAQAASYHDVPKSDQWAVWLTITIIMALFWPFIICMWAGVMVVELAKRL